ncbi:MULTISPECIES: TonB-dependent siderophore receptor [unclassified Rhizobium]|jgi:iron complex outermembrane receptor protein|uniref:TonB-dependent siderophore receptor n=1 Tax=unclassified Rhizobium TaxID=2613769 RepID=UPI000648C7EB|nr:MULTISPECIES: TonB-dependent siderophore receptor [unclassified Rhizobium]MBN8954975.1 TonB-dependent siderophore receptor [Rhizobium tropici]OJY63344.1 MAG: ligand-gated channel [Rhizobium sp. 60-20]RKD35975.1 iron complex outermembrane receptor protein [Rhizobium sp. WW_1]
MDINSTGRRSNRAFSRSLKTVLFGCTALVALTPAMLFAQEAGSDTTLAPIVIKGSGTSSVLNTENDSKSIVATETTGVGKMPTDILVAPASVSVITSKEIEERAADSVEKVVQYTAGVSGDFYGSDDRYDYFDIRGFVPYTYRDGLAIGRTFGGVREEPYAFERIEVLKGTSSAGFGVAEPGGSVNYVTKLPKRERFGEVYGTGGSFAHKEAGFDFGDNITEDDTLSYRLTGKFQRADGEYDYSRDNENFIMGGLTWRPTDVTSLSFVFDHLDKRGTPGSGGQPYGTDFRRSKFFGEPDYYFNDTNRNTYSLLLDHDFGDGLSFSSKARYSNSKLDFGSVYPSSLRTDGSHLIDRYYFGSDTASEQFVIDAHLMYEANFDNVESRTLAGIDYNNFKSENYGVYVPGAPPINWLDPVYSGAPSSISPTYGTRNDQKTTGLYLQEDLTFADRLTVSLGLRNDWLDLSETDLFAISNPTTSGNHSEFSKRVGVSYKFTEEWAAFASYGESVAPPAIGADPTTGKQYEVGVKYRPDAFPALFTASIYDLTKGNITTYDSVTYIPQTVKKVRHRGLELEAKAEVTDNINLIAAYSYIDSRIDEPGGANDGNRLMHVPKHMASAWGTYTLEGEGARGDMTFGLGARYVGSYFTDLANTTKSEGAVVFDAAFVYKIQKNTTLQVNASNLFDEKHLVHQNNGIIFYNPGRTIMATLRQTW